MESSIQQTHFKVVRYPYENPVEGMVGISDKGEVYVYAGNDWILRNGKRFMMRTGRILVE